MKIKLHVTHSRIFRIIKSCILFPLYLNGVFKVTDLSLRLYRTSCHDSSLHCMLSVMNIAAYSLGKSTFHHLKVNLFVLQVVYFLTVRTYRKAVLYSG